MQTDGCREAQSLFLCQLMELFHERKETLAGLHRPVAVDLQLVDILDAVCLVHLHDALQDFLRQTVGVLPHHVVDNKYSGDDFFFAEYVLFRGYGGTRVRGLEITFFPGNRKADARIGHQLAIAVVDDDVEVPDVELLDIVLLHE